MFFKSDNNKHNHITISAIEEGRCMAYDKSVKGYTDMNELKTTLDELSVSKY